MLFPLSKCCYLAAFFALSQRSLLSRSARCFLALVLAFSQCFLLSRTVFLATLFARSQRFLLSQRFFNEVVETFKDAQANIERCASHRKWIESKTRMKTDELDY